MRFFVLFVIFFLSLGLGACSVNPATGKSQFTALMSPSQENEVGAQEHEKVIAQFGLYENRALQDYVSTVGARVVTDTERPDVSYKFFVLDSPVVNAFALPGGYIYVTRGLLALANSEAELAGVLGHEAGHITGKHSAERYSHGVVTSLGTTLLSMVLDVGGVGQALGLGSELYLKSYSRSQENEADTLGIRYMNLAGYDPHAVTAFLESLRAQTVLEAQMRGEQAQEGGYFATHPATTERVNKTRGEAAALSGGVTNRDIYLGQIDGMTHGDSARHGFTRSAAMGATDFYHPELGFVFTAPKDFKIVNSSNQIIVTKKDGPVVIFDLAARESGKDALSYLTTGWMSGEVKLGDAEILDVNGSRAASAAFNGRINGNPATIRLMVIEWKPNRFARFQIAIPPGTDVAMLDNLKRITYSFRSMSALEKQTIKPYRVALVTAKAEDTTATLGKRMVFDDFKEARFAVMNGLEPGMPLEAGKSYKIITD